jgi:hypothetical protein
MSFDIVVIYLCVLTLQSVFTPLMMFHKWRSGSIKQPVSKGELRYVVLRILLTGAIAALGWALYLSRLSYLLIIPLTALLDCGVMVLSALLGERIAKRLEGNHAA